MNDLPGIYAALDAGVVNPDQMSMICRYAGMKAHREYAIRDQDAFIGWAKDAVRFAL